jgi:hypothetical protein
MELARFSAVRTIVKMLEPHPSRPAPSPDAELLWTSRPRDFDGWFGEGFAVLMLWAVVIFMVLLATLSPMTVAARVGVLAAAGLLGVPFALLRTLPLLPSHARSIWIDRTARIVYFENVYLHNSFRLPRRVRYYPCPFDDILWVQFTPSMRRGPEGLIVTSIHARMHFGSFERGLEGVAEVLRPFARGGRVPLSHASWLPAAIAGVIVFGGLILGYYMGWLP